MQANANTEIKLTAFSRGAGCGCKISPAVLRQIIGEPAAGRSEHLLVGYQTNDDAAVYDLGNGTALISTTDFFMPIVDDAYDFGRIAAANAISDVYAMGGKPALALAILGWPVDKLPPDLAKKVLDGARSICNEAGIPLAGGHSVDSAEPLFGLSVNGFLPVANLKKNSSARENDHIFMTKALGSGILSTAIKRGLLDEEHRAPLLKQMTSLNAIGEELGKIAGVTAMTDVTGFGLLGHLIEMAEGSGLSATIQYSSVPLLPGVTSYLERSVIPDATYRNWNAYEKKVAFGEGVNVMQAFSVLPDPQTNGGLLFTVAEDALDEVRQLLKQEGLQDFSQPLGRMTRRSDKPVLVEK